nr:MAG TPA: hypothetical protein [Siphoviridae sp. ctJsG2]
MFLPLIAYRSSSIALLYVTLTKIFRRHFA